VPNHVGRRNCCARAPSPGSCLGWQPGCGCLCVAGGRVTLQGSRPPGRLGLTIPAPVLPRALHLTREPETASLRPQPCMHMRGPAAPGGIHIIPLDSGAVTGGGRRDPLYLWPVRRPPGARGPVRVATESRGRRPRRCHGGGGRAPLAPSSSARTAVPFRHRSGGVAADRRALPAQEKSGRRADAPSTSRFPTHSTAESSTRACRPTAGQIF
jgi:hypothetical protein